MKEILSIDEIWEKVSLIGQLNETEVERTEKDGFIYSKIYFDGKQTESGTVRIFAVFAYPKGATKSPCVILAHGLKGKIDYSYIDFFLKQDIAVLMCDMAGEREGENHTLYPLSLENCNRDKYDFKKEVTLSVFDSLWHNWSLITRFGIKFLKAQPNISLKKIGLISFFESATIGWQLGAIEEDLAFCANLFYGGWESYALKEDQNFDHDTLSYIAQTEPQSFAGALKVPTLFLAGSNYEKTNLKHAFDTRARTNGTTSELMYVTPNSNNFCDYYATRNLRLFLNQYLFDLDIKIPSAPILSVDTEGVVTCHLDAENSHLITSCEIFYSYGKNNSSRCWRRKSLVKGSDDFVGTLDVNTGAKLHLFANVVYKNGFSVTSNLVSIFENSETTTKSKSSLVYDVTMGYDAFFGFSGVGNVKAEELFSTSPVLEMAKGDLDLLGITSKKMLATYKLGIAELEKTDREIQFQFFSREAQKLTIMVTTTSKDIFSAKVDLVDGLWQKITLPAKDFINATFASLKSFDQATLLFFNGGSEFLLSSINLV